MMKAMLREWLNKIPEEWQNKIKDIKYKKTIFIATVFVFVLFGQFVSSIYNNLIDKSSYTDWISAFCNVVMASAALGAYIFAKDYFFDMAKQDGYKLSIKINTEILPALEKSQNLSVFILLDDTTSRYIEGRAGVFANDDTETVDDELLRTSEYITKNISNGVKAIRELKSALDELEVYGWYVRDEKKKILDDLIQACEFNLSHFRNIKNVLKELFSRQKPELLPKEKTFIGAAAFCNMKANELCDVLSRSCQAISTANDEYDKVYLAFNSYFKDGKNLKNFFFYK
ncbi:hypothetical protein AB9H26_06260 [Yersinia enterocolitica]|uniref:hypothetical protein n=1 Tax=Yersinia enterocolitica TaxID=630 RepID=UPI0033092BF2|nr:hypothetical protein [Yersinia enterocolitica]HDL7909463.1 hypothetical protein [Yersinia enterocolitica]